MSDLLPRLYAHRLLTGGLSPQRLLEDYAHRLLAGGLSPQCPHDMEVISPRHFVAD